VEVTATVLVREVMIVLWKVAGVNASLGVERRAVAPAMEHSLNLRIIVVCSVTGNGAAIAGC